MRLVNWKKICKEKEDENKRLKSVIAGLKEELFRITEQPKLGNWVLCSEQSPVKNDWYWVTVSVDGREPVGMLGRYSDGEWKKYYHDKVEFIAWMPLPSAYIPEKKETVPEWKEATMKKFMKVE